MGCGRFYKKKHLQYMRKINEIPLQMNNNIFQSEDGENKEEQEVDEEEVKSPTFVPRRTGFWDHDNRFSDIPVEESRYCI